MQRMWKRYEKLTKLNKVQMFKKLGQKTKSIFETQGLLELLNDFCVNKRCLNCQIGVKLLNSWEQFKK